MGASQMEFGLENGYRSRVGGLLLVLPLEKGDLLFRQRDQSYNMHRAKCVVIQVGKATLN